MDRKKPGRKAEPPSKRRIAWPRWTGFRGMTVRDWLQLLVVPLALVAIGFWFTMQQDARQQQIEDQRAIEAQQIEDRRAKAERKLAEQRAQDEALQAYLDQMSQLMLEKDLRSSTEDNATEDSKEARILARARTLTVLQRLDTSRKTQVMQFLVEGCLVQGIEGQTPMLQQPIIPLSIRTFTLPLPGADGAVERGGFRFGMEGGSGTEGSGVDLSGVDLSNTDLTGAHLLLADLSGANLTFADLSSANLLGADLSGANLSNADLSNADLSYAQGMTNEQLEQQTPSLEGATMPNGQTRSEDWLESSLESSLESRGSGEDGEIAQKLEEKIEQAEKAGASHPEASSTCNASGDGGEE